MDHKKLRRNPPEVKVTSGQTLCTKIIYIALQTSVRLFFFSLNDCLELSEMISFQFWEDIFKEIISNNTKRRKQMLNFLWNTWKCWWNETDDEILPVFAQFLWTLKLFSRIPMGNCFCFYLRQLFTFLTFRKWKKDCNILKNYCGTRRFLVHLKMKLREFLHRISFNSTCF